MLSQLSYYGEATSNMEAARYKKKSGTFSSKKTTTIDTFNDTSIGSNLSAESITLVAGATIADDGSVSTQQGQGNTNVIGSLIQANGDVTLKADDQINLIAAQNVDTLKSKNSGSSASIGVSFGTDGLLFTASASGSKGKTHGNGTTWTETHIQSGNQDGDTVKLESGTDTNIIGSQVAGNQVIANVGSPHPNPLPEGEGASKGGNFNIQSLQDTNQYKDKQQSVGGSISIGYGKVGGSFNYADSKTKSNYASVNEQAGIFTGDGGFQVNVAGNTNLKGAVMASTDQAANTVDINGKPINSLTTQTLTTSNIENEAEYEAEAMSVSVGSGTQGGKPTITGAGKGSDSGRESGVTVSGISQGAVNITDSTAQQTLTGKDSQLSVARLNRDVIVNEQGEAVNSQGNSTANAIAPIFDQEKVAKEIQAQIKITQAFSQQAPVALNSYAKDKTSEINRQIEVAEAAGDTATVTALKMEVKNWSEGGDYRTAANIVIAAISGGANGTIAAVTKESLAWAADQMRQAMIEDSRKFKGLCVSETDCISNMSGQSVGVNGDNTKVAGGRLVLADWCRDGACELDKTTISGYKENADGTVIFNPKDENGNALTIQQIVDLHPDWRSPLGGHQGGEGQMSLFGIQFSYDPNSFWDNLAEAFSGTHDTLNSFIWYDELGNAKEIHKGTLLRYIGDTTNMTNVGVATPFALSVLLPPEVWSSVLALIRSK